MAATTLLHEFFDTRWRQWPGRTAVDIPPGRGRPDRLTATYGELAALSARIEGRLAPHRSPGSVVAILLPRTRLEAFAAQLAILRSGCAYTSLDPVFPDQRIAELLRDAEAAAIVTDAAGEARLRSMGMTEPLVLVDGLTATDDQPPPNVVTPETVAYLIYTSGTTGKPKGVMIEHRAIANLVQSDLDEFQLGERDRVVQGSSHAYDSSLEEIWLALAAGATVVVMDDDTARAGPDVVPWLERERITVFCPPPTLLRATGVRTAAGLLPELRLLYVGGEALHADVVDLWAPGRTMVNGYGPTECAVVATRGHVAPGQPVTIGRPIPGNTAWILTADLCDVAAGEIGELYVGGAGLARGYRNDPDLTARKFVMHPEHGRLYRTGDLARRLPGGDLLCLGRADSQVKIRGYRVELDEIDTRLAALPGVRQAASCVQGSGGRQQIVSYVVAEHAASALDVQALRRSLASTLPAYMVPARIGLLPALPTTTGGKLDRSRLPILESRVDDDGQGREPQTAMEVRIEAALRRLLDRSTTISTSAHFFEDLGGDSLLAAELVTALRAHPDTSGLTVRDAYEAPTIASLADRAEHLPVTAAPPDRELPPLGGRPVAATFVQTLWLLLELVAVVALAYGAVAWLAPGVMTVELSWTAVLAAAVVAAVGTPAYVLLSLIVAVLMKRLVVGRYVAGRAPVWGRFYVQHWIVCQTLRLVPWRLLDGTVFQLAALRALGARIGRRVHIHRGVDLLQGGWDLLEIGDDATIGQEAVIRLVDLEDEQIVVGPVVIGAGATLETRSSVAGRTVLESNAFLTALSSLPAGARVPAGERWDGVPARPAGQAPHTPALDRPSRELSPFMHGVLMFAARVISAFAIPGSVAVIVMGVLAAQGLGADELAAWMRSPWSRPTLFWMVIGAAVLSVPAAAIGLALAMRLLGRVPAGVISRWDRAYLRIWTKTDIVRRAGDWLSGTLMWPIWLRAAGMRIGRRCEISTIIDVVPELVSIGPDTFFADGVYLGGPRVHRGTVTLRETTLGSDVFLGNHVIIPTGCTVPDGVLIGVSTVADDSQMQRGTSWFGHPPFALSRPPMASVDRRYTHDPSLIRYLNRWLWEVGRFAIPCVSAAVLLLFGAMLLRIADTRSSPAMAMAVAPILVIGAGISLCVVVLALKWLLLGRVRPGQHPLWSCWCSRWDFLYVAWGRLARPFLARLDGTLLLAWYLRAMGMRIGRRVVLGPGFAQVVDPDMIRIDDGATVHALFQAHTFEDRVLKIDRVRIRRRASVGCGSVLFYGVDVGEGAAVAAQSVIMKNERLPARHVYEGAPAAIVRH